MINYEFDTTTWRYFLQLIYNIVMATNKRARELTNKPCQSSPRLDTRRAKEVRFQRKHGEEWRRDRKQRDTGRGMKPPAFQNRMEELFIAQFST